MLCFFCFSSYFAISLFFMIWEFFIAGKNLYNNEHVAIKLVSVSALDIIDV